MTSTTKYPRLKIAVVHHCMETIGGAEKVTLTMVKDLGADLITTNYDETSFEKLGFSGIPVISIGRIRDSVKNKQQRALIMFLTKKLPPYDLYIICSSWAMSALVRNKPNICYMHSPIREIWDLSDGIRRTKKLLHQRILFDFYVKTHRILNHWFVKHTGFILCNSTNTQRRTITYLGRDSLLIYPPVEVKRIRYGTTGDYWLSVNRLCSHKRIDLQMEAFSALKDEKLIIVGSYGRTVADEAYVKKVMKWKPDNVEIKSFITEVEKEQLYANCKAFITTSEDEDFGMNAVEAMAAGKPVVAVNEGGYRETVINGKTGYLVNPDTKSIIQGIHKVKNPQAFKENCEKQAGKFSRERFMTEIKQVVRAISSGEREIKDKR